MVFLVLFSFPSQKTKSFENPYSFLASSLKYLFCLYRRKEEGEQAQQTRRYYQKVSPSTVCMEDVVRDARSASFDPYPELLIWHLNNHIHYSSGFSLYQGRKLSIIPIVWFNPFLQAIFLSYPFYFCLSSFFRSYYAFFDDVLFCLGLRGRLFQVLCVFGVD